MGVSSPRAVLVGARGWADNPPGTAVARGKQLHAAGLGLSSGTRSLPKAPSRIPPGGCSSSRRWSLSPEVGADEQLPCPGAWQCSSRRKSRGREQGLVPCTGRSTAALGPRVPSEEMGTCWDLGTQPSRVIFSSRGHGWEGLSITHHGGCSPATGVVAPAGSSAKQRDAPRWGSGAGGRSAGGDLAGGWQGRGAP